MSGFFGKMIGEFEGMQGAPGAAGPGAGNLVSELIDSAGGMSGIVQKFSQAGMGDKVSSWMGSGGNVPLMAQEVLKVFPQDQLEALAAKHGVPADMVAQVLAHVLPQAVDQGTPGGAAPAAAPDSAADSDPDKGWA